MEKQTIRNTKIKPPTEWSKERLKEFRKKIGVTQKMMAFFLNLKTRTYEAYEYRGNISEPARRLLDIIENDRGYLESLVIRYQEENS